MNLSYSLFSFIILEQIVLKIDDSDYSFKSSILNKVILLANSIFKPLRF